MCTILEQIKDEKKVTGYKIVVTDKYGHYYSPYTGLRYEKGKVPVVKNPLKHKLPANAYMHNVLEINDKFHNAKYKGFTGIIINKYNAESELDAFRFIFKENNFVLLEMTLSGELYRGKYNNMHTYIGTHIDSFKKIK